MEELAELEEKTSAFWLAIADEQDQEEIYYQFSKIFEQYRRYIYRTDDWQAAAARIRLGLKFLEQTTEDTYLRDVAYEIVSDWQKLAENDALDVQLEKVLIDAVKAKKLANTTDISHMAYQLFQHKHYQHAAVYYELIHTQFDEAQDARAWIECYEKLEDHAQAFVATEKSLAIFPEDERLRLKYGQLLADLGRYEEAIKLLDIFIHEMESKKYQSENNYALALSYKAFCHQKLGQPLQAYFAYSLLTSTNNYNRPYVEEASAELAKSLQSMAG